LYECEPSAGLFRKFNDTQTDHPDYNEWQLHKMPIKKSFCDSWYTACYNDYFCGEGSYFGCAEYYWENLAAAELKAKKDEDEEKNGLLIGLLITGALAVLGLMSAVSLIMRERSGKPIFAPPGEGPVGVSS
jgi:hypothetical protein